MATRNASSKLTLSFPEAGAPSDLTGTCISHYTTSGFPLHHIDGQAESRPSDAEAHPESSHAREE